MKYINLLFALLLLAAGNAAGQKSAATNAVPDLSGSYTLLKGNCTYDDAKEKPLVFIRGTLVIERIDSLSFAYYAAVTPKGLSTVGRCGILTWQKDHFGYAHPNGRLRSNKSVLEWEQGTLSATDRSMNAVETQFWKQVPPGSITDKYQLRQITESRRVFDLQKNLDY